jgi:hypothetical protein|tara:strand:+ start:353 stop:721 length:369 start_codon:yes stop_codon:yes gene_type:complete
MKLSRQEIHQMGMNLVGKHLQKNDYEFLAVKSDFGQSPQFICLKNEKELFFVLVRTVVFPKDPQDYDQKWMDKMKLHAKSKKARLLYAGIGLADSTEMMSELEKGRESVVNYQGLVEISLTI